MLCQTRSLHFFRSELHARIRSTYTYLVLLKTVWMRVSKSRVGAVGVRVNACGPALNDIAKYAKTSLCYFKIGTALSMLLVNGR